ncbi:uncharacterized protein C1494.07-like isoform X1 [Maniola jurtina]|uniref:uncharacterized protein C1494.07-like isoform X1 n=1 Tax=Maniola jurtina TaxID=191418 RepID=UPI001E6894FA|nr:uncharacterized protein C1494.07-like isoform X1 [Maniola jurtina]XP_045773983.1 uncharacterized protein C1494.07-like isoform X1 [Maniola jurtina]
MELLENVIIKLNVHTKEIRSEDLQDIMLIIKKTHNSTEQFQEIYSEILAKLWDHLSYELPAFDNQLLCCTCFYSVLSNLQRQDLYLEKALQIINHEIMSKRATNDKENNTSVAVSLCYGLFQSSYLIQEKDQPLEELKKLLKGTFDLLMLMANEYSQYTFIVFKIMTAFKKVIDTPCQEYLFNRERKIKLLNLINHNWENPITGVRNLNRILFQMLLLILNNDIYEKVLNEINSFYWNKGKFLMLTEIIEHSNGNVEKLVLNNQWIHGLTKSLNNPGLVSAGADMYYAILKKLISESSWTKLFLTDVMKILTGLSFKAIENFSNYWCLTTFKTFPSLAQILLNELQNIEGTELKLYSCISVLKQANKLGLVEKTWSVTAYTDEENMVLGSLEHCDANIRMLAFEIICVSQKKSLPTEIEFQQILKFLENNVNSDSTVLRLSILNSLSNFFVTLHTSFLNYYKHNTNKEEHINMQDFCKNLQIFVIESLNLNGNYQRKITTVRIIHLILKHFNEVPKRKQKQTREMNYSLIDYLKENGHWLLNSRDFIMKLISLLKDPATDVHDCIFQLLLEFYLPDISDTMTMNYLIEESLTCIKSKFFFEISCGLNIFKLIINTIIIKKQVAARFQNIEDLFYFAYNEIITEYTANIDVVESIARGKQLHSFLSLLYIIFDANIKNSYQMVLPAQTIFTLLSILKDMSNQFAWEEETNTSSDFSKMNDMVLSKIKNSNFNENTYDQTKISGLYQIVLNCLWLNVKASCELAAIIIQQNKENIKVCEESLTIIAHVLETSRHKGAIEAAGAALGQGIRYLTSLETESEAFKLPLFLLQRKLNELLHEITKMSSVTRRGAGLSIMVHRIVSNDAKKGRPLFHYFMRTILNTCSSTQGTCDMHQEDSADEKDLPKAIYIHFLTRIVTDSSLASDMMYYSAELAELAFGNLTNSHWQIRNAALQLYGALLPKLIGQKKPSGTDDEIISSVACDEFRTHSIKLWDSVLKQIKNDVYQDIIQGHSNLVPILNMLANIARRYNFSYDLDEQNDSDFKLLPNVLALLGSPIYTVRRLTAKLILNIYSFEIILNAIAKVTITSENHLHGILLVIGNCYKVYSDVESYKNQLDDIRNEYGRILMRRNLSSVCRWRLDKLFTEEIPEVTVDMIKNILIQGTIKQHEPGAFLWINQQMKKSLENMPWNILPEVMSLLLNTHDFEMYCEIMAQRIKNCRMVPEKILQDVSEVLLSSNLKTKSCVLWKTLYFISHRVHFNMHISGCYLQENFSSEVSYKMRYMIPFATRLFAVQADYENLLMFSRKIFLLCNPESNDIDMRYIAAIANNELAFTFTKFPDAIRINAIKSAILLLQDEEEDIRNLSVTFYKELANQNKQKHPFICLNEILKEEFLFAQLSEPELSVQNICEDLLHYIDSVGTHNCDELNPFANDSKNIYLEVNVLRQLLKNNLSKLAK